MMTEACTRLTRGPRLPHAAASRFGCGFALPRDAPLTQLALHPPEECQQQVWKGGTCGQEARQRSEVAAA